MRVGGDPDQPQPLAAGLGEQPGAEVGQVGGDEQRARRGVEVVEGALERGELEQACGHGDGCVGAEEQRRELLLDNRAERQHDAGPLPAHGAAPVLPTVALGIGAVALLPSRSRSILPTLFASASSLASDGSLRATVIAHRRRGLVDPGWWLADAEDGQVAGDHARARQPALAGEGGEHAHPVADREVAAERVQRRHGQRERRRAAARSGQVAAAERQPRHDRRREPAAEQRRLGGRGDELREQGRSPPSLASRRSRRVRRLPAGRLRAASTTSLRRVREPAAIVR